MTISPDTRRLERMALLRGLLDVLGEDACDGRNFFVGVQCPDVRPSAWLDLSDEGIIVSDMLPQMYKFTASGWLAAVRETNSVPADENLRRCSLLMKTLKRAVDDAGGELAMFVWQHEGDPTLPTGWVYNALVSGLLAETFPNRQINHYWNGEPPMVFLLPANFGRRRV